MAPNETMNKKALAHSITHQIPGSNKKLWLSLSAPELYRVLSVHRERSAEIARTGRMRAVTLPDIRPVNPMEFEEQPQFLDLRPKRAKPQAPVEPAPTLLERLGRAMVEGSGACPGPDGNRA